MKWALWKRASLVDANADCTLTFQSLWPVRIQEKISLLVGCLREQVSLKLVLSSLRETWQNSKWNFPFRTYAWWRSPIDFVERLVVFCSDPILHAYISVTSHSKRSIMAPRWTLLMSHTCDFIKAQTCIVFFVFVAGFKSNCCCCKHLQFFIQCECPISQMEQADRLTLSTNSCVIYCTLIWGSK